MNSAPASHLPSNPSAFSRQPSSQPPRHPPPAPGAAGDAPSGPVESLQKDRRPSREHRRRRSSVSDRISATATAIRRSISPRKREAEEPPLPHLSADRIADYTMAPSLGAMSRPEMQHHGHANAVQQQQQQQDRPISPEYQRSPGPGASPSRRHVQTEKFHESASPGRGPALTRVQRGTESRGSNGSMGSDHSSSNQHARRRHGKESRAKLSLALRMAHHAVLVDNSGEYDQAIDAYEEACQLLSEAIMQSDTEDDRKRLLEIHASYASRADELRQLYQESENTQRFSEFDLRPSLDDALDREDLAPIVETATMTRIVEPGISPAGEVHRPTQTASTTTRQPVSMPRPLVPKRAGEGQDAEAFASNVPTIALPTDATASAPYGSRPLPTPDTGFTPSHKRSGTTDTEVEFDAALDAAVEAAYMEGYEPYRMEEFDRRAQRLSHRFSLARAAQALSHTEEQIVAEREAKIQAARAQVAAQRWEREQQAANSRELAPPAPPPHDDDEAKDEEAILDSFMATKAAWPESSTHASNIGGPGRQSDSSGFSGQTWGSSVASSLTTAGTTLSTVDENPSVLTRSSQKDLPLPPETPTLGSIDAVAAAPFPPRGDSQIYTNTASAAPLPSSPPMMASPQSPTVRERRMSEGKAARALKIRTSSAQDDEPPALPPLDRLPTPEPFPSESGGLLKVDDGRKPWQLSSPFPSPLPISKFSREGLATEEAPSTQPPAAVSQQPTWEEPVIRPSPPSTSPQRSMVHAAAPPVLQHSASSLSLRNQSLQPSLQPSPSAGTEFDPSPSTPISFAFNSLGPGKGPMAPMNTPANFNFAPSLPPQPVSETQIFDHDLHSPTQAGMGNPEAANAPRVLEPCPEATMLRPYWLMRCLYQTLAHPRGGYISQRLFIPREVWRAKNVKLKGIDEKISVCDLLTAALMKLASVDTYDADAVLEELQSFENILDQAQSTLNKKLGNEVGISNISSLFKDAPTLSSPGGANGPDGGSSQAGDHSSGGGRSSSKGYFSSFRKLGRKGSSANLAGSNALHSRDSGPSHTMPTVPMTSSSSVTRGFQKHQTIPDAKYIGPHGAYMGSLARLCDAAQILDQIARQVEDPGLRHSSPTHVGLELCSRHAAEFFAFYICRFILQDVIMLSDKYIKKANEWVNS